ncbi:MAG: Xaa-Pro aminopeptidase [Cryomorphaceae bacterium BACL21 MAG-121220-bin10]|jgi:hypothetical protein|nr:MAG: Xaa-Pro aminopeptidase [Cryomorphaceae bacterium BACL21 MAG-121220-bin10]|tara:strand:+ start:18570 stop:19916 length:1347 start_codon:yes stop_codon:yes gene_type:complete
MKQAFTRPHLKCLGWKLFLAILLSSNLQGQVLTEKAQAERYDNQLYERIHKVLPSLMEQHGIDMWLLISREYNEDPILRTFLPATWLNARRRTIILFYKDEVSGSFEALAVARYGIGNAIKSAWDKEQQPDQWARLLELIQERDPKVIGLNYSEDYGIADGIVKTDYEGLMAVLPTVYQQRVVSAEPLAVSWIETRTPSEMAVFASMVDLTHDIIAEAFSRQVITPGKTTSDDVVWWLRQKVTDLGLQTWFHPTIDIQRSDEALKSHIEAFSNGYSDQVIMPGDLLHCDFGISYLGLNTDCQQHAYVPFPQENEVPEFLKEAFNTGNRVQDLFTGEFVQGRTGNEILASALQLGRTQGLRPSIYTHPLGTYGHSAGTTLGMWDAQNGVPGSGDYALQYKTAYAIELNNTVYLSQWKKDIRIMLEEAGYFDADGFRYVSGRQEGILLVD